MCGIVCRIWGRKVKKWNNIKFYSGARFQSLVIETDQWPTDEKQKFIQRNKTNSHEPAD